MYLVIMEDGSFYQAQEVGDSEFHGVATGVCSVVNMKDKTFYNEGDWYDLPLWSK
jgi:hypothetical protein